MRLTTVLGGAFAAAVSTLVVTLPALASCDLCTIYSAERAGNPAAGDLFLGVFEQFSSFTKLKSNGDSIDDPANQYLKSSVTQIVGRYDLTDSFGLQATVPFIRRQFRRAEGDDLNIGSETGIGDASLLAIVTPLRFQEGESWFRASIRAGIELPTGDTERLREAGDDHHAVEVHEKHGGEHHEENVPVPTGVHGHDLALGSGSWDVPFGVMFAANHERWIANALAQYTYRTEGDFGYRYADDLLWSVSAGRYLLLDEGGTIALRANLIGEYKGKDRQHGEIDDSTGRTSLLAGPQLDITLRDKVFGLFAVDLPITVNNTGEQLTADYRLRMALTVRF